MKTNFRRNPDLASNELAVKQERFTVEPIVADLKQKETCVPPGYLKSSDGTPAENSSWTLVQQFERPLQLLKFLSRFAEFSFRGQSLVLGKVFGSLRNQGLGVR